MSVRLPTFSKAKASYQEFTKGLETFLFEDISDSTEIGRGTFGSVLLASFKNKQKSTTENVVVKKLLSSSRSDEKQKFFKEARLLNSLSHKNITSFKKVCIEPPAIMMEFVAFEFKYFCPDAGEKQVSNLQDFLGHLDENDAVDAFPPNLYLKIACDVGDGLQYLHESNVFHRDLKTSNILVSNKHYCDQDSDNILTSFNLEPIVCKFSDFGESRSEKIQTQLLGSTKTSNVDRGTPSRGGSSIKSDRSIFAGLHELGGSGGMLPRKIFKFEPRKCHLRRSEHGILL